MDAETTDERGLTELEWQLLFVKTLALTRGLDRAVAWLRPHLPLMCRTCGRKASMLLGGECPRCADAARSGKDIAGHAEEVP
jgi:hypothetical protein